MATASGLAPDRPCMKGTLLELLCIRGGEMAPALGFAPRPPALTGRRTTVVPRW